jgi:hypothetical protein
MIKHTKKKKEASKPHPESVAAGVDGKETAHGRARARTSRRSEANEEVLQELTALRNIIDQMVEHYAIRVGGQLSELMQLIQGDGDMGEKPNGLTVKAASAMLAAIRTTQLKPKKGRPKDFVRAQKLVRRLRELSPLEN